MKSGNRNNMADTAQLKARRGLIIQIRPVTQHQRIGERSRILREYLVDSLTNYVSQMSTVIANGYLIALFP